MQLLHTFPQSQTLFSLFLSSAGLAYPERAMCLTGSQPVTVDGGAGGRHHSNGSRGPWDGLSGEAGVSGHSGIALRIPREPVTLARDEMPVSRILCDNGSSMTIMTL